MSEGAPVVVVGAGWAGLAACVELVDAGFPVLLLEATRRLGGRARSIRFGESIVDNGQHVLLGAYRSVLGLLARLGVAESDAFLRLPLVFRVRSATGREICLRMPGLPPPFGLGLGMLAASGLSVTERVRGAMAGARLLQRDPGTGTVAQFLDTTRQPTLIRQAIWEPLCLAALNTPARTASAEVFRDVLRAALFGGKGASDLLLPKQPLEALFPEPAKVYLKRFGARVELRTAVRGLDYDVGRLRGVLTAQGPAKASHVILATQLGAASRLLGQTPGTRALAESIPNSTEHDITTVYLRYAPGAAIDPPMQGMVGSHAQWLIDRRSCGQPGIFAAVASASDTEEHWKTEEMTDALSRLFPELGAPVDVLRVRERRATFAATADFEASRPGARTAIPRLYLAGDWTDTGLPGTLEGAVRSGLSAAAQVIAERGHSEQCARPKFL